MGTTMAFRVASHIFRNRHGTFYFRAIIPKTLREFAGRGEVRFSLLTEQRQVAIITALPLIADLPRLEQILQRMSDNNETLPPDYFKLWRILLLKNASLGVQVTILKEEVASYQDQIAGMVPKAKARNISKQAHTLGQLKGQNTVMERLEFPWAPERTRLFSELSAAYLKQFTHRVKGGVKKPIGEKTLEGYTKDIGFFVTVMGDPHIGAIDREVAGEYFSILRRLPPNISRVAKYRGKAIPEILEMNDPPQSEYNSSKKLERPSGMFKWALKERRKWGIDANPFEGFGQSGDNESKRRPFTAEELKALLTHPDFVNQRFRSAYSFWLIPLGIFTGARLGELCQLDLKDFVVVEGIDCISVNDIEAYEDVEVEGRRKRLKTKNARRLVPIHPELIRIGVLRYVEEMREKKQAHLFPELSRTRRDGPAQAASNWFQRFRDRAGITEKQVTVFHSFRHGFITNLLDGDIAPHQVAPIVGHESDLITGKIYWDKKDASKRKPTVDAFTLPPELLELFPTIEDVKFVRSSGPRVGKGVPSYKSL